MSKFSGRNDLYDVMMSIKTYPIYPDNEHSPTTSDELECFELFKKKTGGKLHQHIFMEHIDILNIDYVKEHCPSFSYEVIKEEVKDKRCSTGTRIVNRYKFKYLEKEYNSFDDLNKNCNVYITIDIPFDSIFDLIPYYPYGCSGGYTRDSYYIIIVKESYIDSRMNSLIQCGFDLECCFDYKQKLQEHYIEVYNKYFNNKN